MAFYSPNAEACLKEATVGRIKINGKDVFSPATKAGDGAIAEMFGEIVNFDFSEMGVPTKGIRVGNIHMYVPAPVRISFPVYDENNHRAPLCYDKDFVVRWNGDSQNKNGVMVIVRWDGTVLFGNDYESSEVIHFKNVPDTGSAKLDDSMFEGIPDTAYCSLLLLRGDVENIDIDELDYQVLAETHDILDFVLVKNIVSLLGKDLKPGWNK